MNISRLISYTFLVVAVVLGVAAPPAEAAVKVGPENRAPAADHPIESS